MFRRAHHQEPSEPPELVIWFPDFDGDDEPPADLGRPEVVQTGDRSLGAVVDQLKARRATPGFRPGGFGDLPERRGTEGEIVTSVLVRPDVASALAADGTLFRPPLRGLSVDDRSLDRIDQAMSWQVTLRLGPVLRRRATLRLQPSPSANLTVLEVMPNRPIRMQARAFVRIGIQAIEELSGRLVGADRRLSVAGPPG